MKADKERDLLSEIQENLKIAIEEDADNRQAALDDLEFIAVDDAQWPADVRSMRLADQRPCLTINKMPAFISQVVGDQRLNRPSIKVIPVDSVGDPEVARILSGWIKNVEYVSKSDIAVDHGFEHAVSCGYGALRVVTKYANDSSFDQDAYIEKIDNALAVYWGKHKEYDCSDAEWCLIITDMGRSEYERKYKTEPMEFNSANSQYVEGWCTKDDVRLAEYFKKVPVKKTLYLFEDGRILDFIPENKPSVVKKRTVDSYEIKWYLVSGNKILEEQTWVGKKYIPVVPIWGKELNVGGKRIVKSLIRDAKDSQRMFNYWNSVDTEVVALQPRVPYIVTETQISGHESMWKASQKTNFPYLVVNPDPKAPGWPKREVPPQASSGMVERITNTDQEMRDTIGLQKASLGMQSNERSGKAIVERKKEGDVGTFVFIDNLSRSIKQVGKILVDIAPGILDTKRVIRLGLENGEQDFVTVNDEVEMGEAGSGIMQTINDPAMGEYDIVVSVGPSFSTQRTEARQSMSEFIQYYPQAAPLIGDLYAKAMDWPGAEDVSERLEFLLPPEVKMKKAAEEAKRNGTEAPSPPQPPPPSPQEINEAEISKVKLEQEKVKLNQEMVQLKQEKVRLAQLREQVTTDLIDEGDEENAEE